MNNVRKLWENSNIRVICPKLDASVRFDEPMKQHTTFCVGGPADLYIQPSCIKDLCLLFEFFAQNGVSVSIMGGGSNLLISDKGIRGAVISLASFDTIDLLSIEDGKNPLVRAGAGSSMKALTEFCLKEKLTGMERFAGLPGSVGGAVFMNARCYDISIADVFFSSDVLRFSIEGCIIEEYPYNPGEWDYKKSPFQGSSGDNALALNDDKRIILSSSFRLNRGEGDKIRGEMEKYIQDRTDKGHFRFPSAGSMFKNNHTFGKPSGKIIDEAGLRGFRIGDAQVAPWHGNIVINAGSARACEIRDLLEQVQKRVYDTTGFFLEPEVILAGEW